MQFGLKRLFAITAILAVLSALLRLALFWTLAALITSVVAGLGLAAARRSARQARPDTPLAAFGCFSMIAMCAFFFGAWFALGALLCWFQVAGAVLGIRPQGLP